MLISGQKNTKIIITTLLPFLFIDQLICATTTFAAPTNICAFKRYVLKNCNNCSNQIPRFASCKGLWRCTSNSFWTCLVRTSTPKSISADFFFNFLTNNLCLFFKSFQTGCMFIGEFLCLFVYRLSILSLFQSKKEEQPAQEASGDSSINTEGT